MPVDTSVNCCLRDFLRVMMIKIVIMLSDYTAIGSAPVHLDIKEHRFVVIQIK